MSSPVLEPPRFRNASFARVLGGFSCLIEGEPKPKARARVTKWGSYTPKDTADYESKLAAELLRARQVANWPVGGWWSDKVQYAVELEFVVSSFRSDIDNLTKSILDAANKLIWPDDTRVISLIVTKRHKGNEEGVGARVRVWAVTNSDNSSDQLAKKPVRRIVAR